ncbi:hypothetical protein M404DRAFT_23263, partial [Pisolithus tinctorius Marx 270]
MPPSLRSRRYCCMQMNFDDDYTLENVPQEILNLVSLDNSINVDVLSMGGLAGSGLDDQAAEDLGLIKNHWVWRLVVEAPHGGNGLIQFGFNVSRTASVPSDKAQYNADSVRWLGSDLSGSSRNGKDASSDDVGSIDGYYTA